jgi:hypothetical protein
LAAGHNQFQAFRVRKESVARDWTGLAILRLTE